MTWRYIPGKNGAVGQVEWRDDRLHRYKMHDVFDPEFWSWRYYNDGTESAATVAADLDANHTIDVGGGDVQIHIRVGVQEIGAGSISGDTTDDYELEYDIDGGGFNSITASSTLVHADTGSSLTEGGATTARLTGGGGSFVAGEQEEDDGQIVDHELTADNHTEHVYALLAVSADASGGEVVTFRLTRNGAANQITNTVAPTLTINKTVGVTRNPGQGDLDLTTTAPSVSIGINIVVPSAGGGSSANKGTLFNGSNQGLDGLTPTSADSQEMTFCVAYKPDNLDASFQKIVEADGEQLTFGVGTDDNSDFLVDNASATQVIRITNMSLTQGAWHIFMCSCDSADTSTARAWHIVGGVENDVSETFTSAETYDWVSHEWGVGMTPAGFTHFQGEIGYLLWSNEFVDFSVEANRRKYMNADFTINAEGLGADGSGIGVTPEIFLPNPFGTFEQNEGSGSDFTANNGPFTEGTVIFAGTGDPPALGLTLDSVALSLDFGFVIPQGDLLLDSVAPEVIAPIDLTIPQGDLVLDSVASVRFEEHNAPTPQGDLQLDSIALLQDFGFPGVQGDLTLDSLASTVFHEHNITVPQGDLQLDSVASSLGFGLFPAQGDLQLDSTAAVRFEEHRLAVPQGDLQIDSVALSMDFGFPIPQGDLLIDSLAPTVDETAGANHARDPPQGDLQLDSIAPSLDFGFPGAQGDLQLDSIAAVRFEEHRPAAPQGDLLLDSVAATVFHEHNVPVPQGDLALDSIALSQDFGLFPGQGDLQLDSAAPTVFQQHNISVPQGDLTLDSAGASLDLGLLPPQGNLTFSTFAPIYQANDETADPPQGDLLLSTFTPTVEETLGDDHFRAPAHADLTLTGSNIRVDDQVPQGNLTFSTAAPVVVFGDRNIVPLQGDLALSETALLRGGTGIVQASRFDAVADKLTISSLTGAVDGTAGTLSFGLRRKGTPYVDPEYEPVAQDLALSSQPPMVQDSGTSNIILSVPPGDLALDSTASTKAVLYESHSQTIFEIGTGVDFGLRAELLANDILRVTARQADDTVVFTCDTSTHLLVTDDRLNVHVSWSGTACVIKVKGVDVSVNTPGSAGNIDYTDKVTIGASDNAATPNRLNADLAELYFEDVQISDSERFYHSPSTEFRELGSDGSLPGGSSPLVYLNNEFTSFAINKGTGGNFTTEGGLDEAVDFGAYTGSALIEVPQGDLTLSGSVPTAVEETPSANHTRNPPQGDLQLTTTAPTRLEEHRPAAPQGDLTLDSTASTRLVSHLRPVPQGDLTLDSVASVRLVDRAVSVPQGDLTLSTTAAVRFEEHNVAVPQGDLTLDSTAAACVVDVPITVPQGDLTLDSIASVRLEEHRPAPSQGDLTLSTTAPTCFVAEARDPPQGDLLLDSVAPTAVVNVLITPAQGDLTLDSVAPTVVATTSAVIIPPAADLALSTTAPVVSQTFAPPVGLASEGATALFLEERTSALIPQEVVDRVFGEERTTSQNE